MELLIKNGRIVDFSKDFIGDIFIEDGIIKEIGLELRKDCEVIDVAGKTVMPAFVDLHSHFRDPGLTHKEDIESGSLAAVKGGYTTVNLMGNTKPICSTMEIVNYVEEKAKKIGLVDANQTVSITRDLEGTDISHLEALEDSVRCISDDGKGVCSSKLMLQAMNIAKDRNWVIMSHAEDMEVTKASTRLSENLMTVRDIELSRFTGAHLHLCHVSTKEAIRAIELAKEEGLNVTCEVTPHHISLTGEDRYRVNPPLREEEDRKLLIDAIRKGVVDAIGTDHAPHTKEDKEKGACGISGIETSFAICYTELVKKEGISLNKLSEIMSKNPSKILKINKGIVEPGYAADLVIVDLEEKNKVDSKEFASKGKNTCFNGMEFYGSVVKTIRAGKVVYDK